MTKTKSTLIVCLLLMVCTALLAACGGGVSAREQAMSTEVAALQTQAARPLDTAVPAPTAALMPTQDALAARIDAYIRGQTALSGAILVAQKGKVLFSQGYGLANRELDVPNTPQTKFAIGSMTKAFTAVAIMMLQERGKLSVQDPICNYIKDCSAAWKGITLHQLLTHTSGIHEYRDWNIYIKKKVDDSICREYKPEELLAYFKDLPLDFAPGDHWSYSNSNYFLLGMVIEKVSGESYENFIQGNILQPLGMTETGYDRTSAIVKNRAVGYTLDQNTIQFVNVHCEDVSFKYAAGGLYSTLGDLYKWDQALYTDQLVSKESLKTIFTSTVSVPAGYGGFPDGSVYGYGWLISQQSGHRLIEHGGNVFGFVSELARYPDDQVTVIVLSNLDTLDPVSISFIVGGMVLGIK
jgi:CubicO group peptidase (beta-lactamase class C family)